MSDIDPDEPVPGALSTIDPAVTNARLGALSQAAVSGRDKARQGLEAKTAQDISAIEETIKAIRASREGGVNLPLMAFGAGMLKTTPGVASNFMGEVGQGAAAAIPAIQAGREQEMNRLGAIGKLQGQLAEVRRKPEEAELDFQNKLSIEAQKLIAQFEAAGLRSNRPFSVPSTGEVVFPNYFGQGKHGFSSPGKPGIITPYNGGAAVPAPAPGGGAGGGGDPDKLAFLQKNVSPDVGAPDLAFKPNIDKLHEIAVADPQLAQELWQIINYEIDPATITNQRGAKIEHRELLRKAREIDPTYQPGFFKTHQANQAKWTGGDQAKIVRNAQTSINHVGELMELGAALENGEAQIINNIRQRVAASMGSAIPTSFDAVAKIASDELAKITVGGQTAQADREEIANIFSRVSSGAQLQEAVRKSLHLLKGRLDPMALEKQQALGNRRKFTSDDLLGPAKDTYQKIMTTGITTPEDRAKWGVKPKEREWPVPSQAAIDQLRKNQDIDVFNGHFGPGAAEKILGR